MIHVSRGWYAMQPDKNWAMEGARYQVKVCGDHESNPGGPIGGSWEQICPPWTLRGSPGPQKGSFGAQPNPFCLFSWAGWFHMGYNSAGWARHSAATVWTPHKPIFGTKRIPKKIGTWKFRDWAQITPFGPLGTLKGPDIRSKCVVTISLTPSDHLRAVGTKSSPPRPS